MPLGTKVGLVPGDFVLDGTPQKEGTQPLPPKKNSAHVYCGQTVAYLSYCSALVNNCIEIAPESLVS